MFLWYFKPRSEQADQDVVVLYYQITNIAFTKIGTYLVFILLAGLILSDSTIRLYKAYCNYDLHIR